MGKIIWTAIAVVFGLLVWAGISFAFGQAIFGMIEFGRLNFSLPSSFGDFFGGLFLAAFLSVPVIFVLGALLSFVGSGFRSGFPILLGFIAIAVASGGLLVFLVPLWIAAISVVSVVGMFGWFAWRERATNGAH